ncbi:polyprenyl synthetase family protein [Neobacillus niacini]|uniref:polyprenyl synthetase family protein n=1 Tax=Neobacillus niacini TaxID=86668 RepID=UPI0021CAF64B|nr:polyprenyl synthetase family protein [Neobacillus niacini]MCM3764886.1 polyprenyl synthetase family protein [Neobacillus niacini]
MNRDIMKEACYCQAESKAAEYFKELYDQVIQKSYIPVLTQDIQLWKHNHIRHPLLSFFDNKKVVNRKSRGYHTYIQWLDYRGKLDNYLDRSISYLYMRDLGKDLNSPETKSEIERVVSNLKNQLTTDSKNLDKFSIAGLYRWGQEENIETTVIWLFNKLKRVSENIPEGMEPDHAQRKLIKIIAGVIMHVLDEMGDTIPPEERSQKLDQAIRLGYAYGLTYPYIDDLLDSDVLTANEKKKYSQLIRTTLITESVPELGEWTGANASLIEFIHAELREAFEYIKVQQQPDTRKHFFEQAYVFFQSQELDREKELTHEHYTNEDLYIPIILKSASSRLIARSVIGTAEDEGFHNRTFYYGIYNQLADDFADMFKDMEDSAVTPYTYYMTYHKQRPDLINPFELYWAVIAKLIHNVYNSDPKTCEVILDRAINGLKRAKERLGIRKYKEVMELLTAGIANFNRLVQKMVVQAVDVDFFDKLLRDHMVTSLQTDRQEQKDFFDKIETVREQINNHLKIPKSNLLEDPIVAAANTSLDGDGKRLRPIMTWVMAVDGYGLDPSAIVPLLRSLEYMHTASLIFDDLPSQDNASMRRGRPTLHVSYNEAIAELTGLFLTQKAVEEQASLEKFDPKAVVKLIQYTARATADMCKGQAMDLDSKGKQLSLDQLNLISYYKTGIAFEASLIMPAILAQAPEPEKTSLEKFARHAGIAFQIKDDLLDVEGEANLLGKAIGKDEENSNSTFVSVLGPDGARKAMWDHYCLAIEVLEEIPHNTSFLKHLMNYIVHRDH